MYGLSTIGISVIILTASSFAFGELHTIDFIDFGGLINFPIFNFADICVVVGVIIVGICYVIVNKGEEIENNSCK